MTHTFPTSPTGNAASLHATQAKPLRREDSALLRGAGCFGQDVVIPNACHIAFVRSPQAHAQLLGIQTVEDQDWVRLTQSQFAPVEITPEFWIVPTWHEPPAQARQRRPTSSSRRPACSSRSARA